MTYINIFINQPIYCAIIGLAILIGVIYFVIVNRKDEELGIKLFTLGVSGTFSIIMSTIACFAVSFSFSIDTTPYRSIFSIFYTFALFPVFVFLLKQMTHEPIVYQDYVNPIILTIMLARFACLYQGCCGGTIYAVHIEIVLLLALFIVNLITKKINMPTLYILYPLWRFIADFFKESYKYESSGGLSVTQCLAILCIVVAITVIVAPKISPPLFERKEDDEY